MVFISVFYKVFSKNRTKMFLKIIINFYNDFIKKIDTVFQYFIRFSFKKPDKNIVGY